MKKNLIMRQSGEDKREKYIYLTPHLAIEQIMNGLKLSLKIVAEY